MFTKETSTMGRLKRKQKVLAAFGFTIKLEEQMKAQGYRYCKYHKQFLSLASFYKNPDTYCCRLCDILLKHNVSFEWFSIKIKEQLGCCAICNKQLLALCYIDHSHACCPDTNSCGKCVRDILCSQCNIATGFIENKTWLLETYKYLILYNSLSNQDRDKLLKSIRGLS